MEILKEPWISACALGLMVLCSGAVFATGGAIVD